MKRTAMSGIGAIGFWIFALILTTAGSLLAQSSAGSISGTVKDKTGAIIPGAAVTIVNPTNAVTQATTSNEAGSFVFPLIPPGDYTITVENAGFKKYEKSNVVLTTGGKLNVGDLVLEVGAGNETVTVQADLGQLQIKS